MSPEVFVVSLTILLVVFLIRKKIVDFLNETLQLSFEIKSEWIVYILTIFFVIIIVLGMLDKSNTTFNNVSVGGGIENLSNSPSTKPHRMFDINFDIFKF